MSGLDYVPLGGLDDHVSFRNTGKAAAGIGLLLVSAAGWAVSQGTRFFRLDNGYLSTFAADHLAQRHDVLKFSRQSDQASPDSFLPTQGIENVVVKPGPLNLLQVVGSNLEEESNMFVYGHIGKGMMASGNFSHGYNSFRTEAWVYGARIIRPLAVAFPTGAKGDVIKGWLLPLTPPLVEKLAMADKSWGHDPTDTTSDRASLRRGITWVVLKDGSTQKAQWYYTETTYSGDISIGCTQCAQTFPSKKTLWVHEKMKHKGLVKCNNCDATFLSQEEFEEHQIQEHSRLPGGGDKPYLCTVCNSTFSKAFNLKVHMRVHTGEQPYQCDICGRNFSQRGPLTSHMRTHTGEKPYDCSVCKKPFRTAGSLKYHLRVHSGEKPYMCRLCNVNFTQPGPLQLHMRTHSGIKPYICDVCNKTFARKGILMLHKRIHSGEKLYQCTNCSQNFTHPSSLSQHMRLHTGEKPYACEVCSRTFTQSGHLGAHMKTHNRVKEEEEAL
eukprot:gb/GEZN01003006.1/.p1 GENE.gb/GEZN01003006.1/~~gb/GEZN01003006.1/.p1  ORF type:complete len:496 (+),score=41.55 gb/GEZN01003006.1/:332-1819(+)